MTHATLPGMIERGRGTILNVISTGALYTRKNISVYSASKWALRGFTGCLEAECAPKGVRVMGFYPGKVSSNMYDTAGVPRDLDIAMTPEQAAEIEAIVAACEAHAEKKGDAEPAGYYQLNLQFHGAVARGAGNAFLMEMIKTNARKLMAYYRARYRFPGSIAQSAKEHREIAELIFAHKREEAEAAMVRHVQFDQVTVMDLLAALG